MKCAECQIYLYPYLDGETALPETLAVQAHLDHCPACRQQCEEEVAFRTLIRQELDREGDLPPALWGRIQRSLRQPQVLTRFWLLARWPSLSRRQSVGVIAAGIATLGLFTVFLLSRRSSAVTSLAVALVDHQAIVQRKTALQITTTEGGEILQWFQARLPFVPPIPAFARVGLRLRGGNLCNIQGVKGATLLYEQAGHLVSYYVFPAKTPEQIPAEERYTPQQRRYYLWRAGSYQVVFWREGDLVCALISDLSETKMVQMAATLLDRQSS
jgi:anti-sigma factor RsiW